VAMKRSMCCQRVERFSCKVSLAEAVKKSPVINPEGPVEDLIITSDTSDCRRKAIANLVTFLTV